MRRQVTVQGGQYAATRVKEEAEEVQRRRYNRDKPVKEREGGRSLDLPSRPPNDKHRGEKQSNVPPRQQLPGYKRQRADSWTAALRRPRRQSKQGGRPVVALEDGQFVGGTRVFRRDLPDEASRCEAQTGVRE